MCFRSSLYLRNEEWTTTYATEADAIEGSKTDTRLCLFNKCTPRVCIERDILSLLLESRISPLLGFGETLAAFVHSSSNTKRSAYELDMMPINLYRNVRAYGRKSRMLVSLQTLNVFA